jgi:hypothetical protein
MRGTAGGVGAALPVGAWNGGDAGTGSGTSSNVGSGDRAQPRTDAASPPLTPCTPRRRLAAALILDSRFSVREQRATLQQVSRFGLRVGGSVECDAAASECESPRGQLLLRAGKKIGDVYALATVVLEGEDCMRVSVHVPETCRVFSLAASHAELAGASREQQRDIASTLVARLCWRSPGELSFSRIA